MASDTGSVSYSMMSFSSNISYGSSESAAGGAAAGPSSDVGRARHENPNQGGHGMGSLAAELFGIFKNFLDKGGSGFGPAGGTGGAGGAGAACGTDGVNGSKGNSVSPKNAQGEVSSDPSDVRELLKSLFGKLMEYSYGDTKNQKTDTNKQAPSGGRGCSGAPSDCSNAAEAKTETKESDSDAEKKAKAKVKKDDDEENAGCNFKNQYRDFYADHYTDHSVDLKIDPNGVESYSDTKTDTKTKNLETEASLTKTNVADDGKTASVDLGGHKFTFNKNESKITVDGGANIYGDPHLKNKDGTEVALFKKDTQVKLADGTKMYVHVTDEQGNPWTKDTKGPTYVNKIALESPDGKMAFIDNISQANNKKMTAEALDAKPGNFADVAVKMSDFKPASELSLDKNAENWKDKDGNALDKTKMAAAEV